MLGETVTVTIDRPLGSHHPKYVDTIYPVNYGYVYGIAAPDGEWQDAYVLGIDCPVKQFVGEVIAVIRRLDDVEEKWVVAPKGSRYSAEQIMKQVYFTEQFFHSEIIM